MSAGTPKPGVVARTARGRACLAALLVAVSATLSAACGSDDADSNAAAQDPAQAAAEYEGELRDAPPELAKIVAQQNELLGGGTDAFNQRLEELRGYPVVVNKWASWCGPCRAEFPFFQSQAAEHGDEVAFLGLDSEDNDDAARTFLSQFPVPYPSYTDPDAQIADELDADAGTPITLFFDSEGEIVHTRPGGYPSEEELAADIERFALGESP